MPRRASRGRLAGLLATILVAVAGCAVGPSARPVIVVRDGTTDTPTTSGRSAPLPPLDEPAASSITWSDCGAATRARLGDTAGSSSLPFHCGQITGVLDAPNNPGVGEVALSVLKAGTGPIPLVVVNDVGGDPGTLYAARLASQLPEPMLTVFSLVGMDRRGTGASDPLQCAPQSARTRIVGFDPADSQLDALLDAARVASQECVLAMDDRLTALDSWRTAGDLEQLRVELGVGHLNAIGHGDGSRVLTAYADRYAGHTGRFVLDGSPDPTLDATGLAKATAAGAEAAFEAFAADCRTRGCALGGNPKQELLALVDQLRAHPMADHTGFELTAGGALHAVLAGLATRAVWPALADAIARARAGDSGPLAQFVAPLLGLVDGASPKPHLPGAGQGRVEPARLDAELTRCNDTLTRLPPEQISSMVRDWSGSMPLFGGLFAQQLLLCSPWPVPASQLAAPSGRNAPPILVLSTASDPVTPEEGTARTARQLVNGLLVSWQGGGHGSLPRSPCATAAAQHFLVDAQVPTDGTACPP
ncbi:MAG: alpha/beta hydrolase [Kutzneria sp.]|nr:alpha/beta hydrolase [Kutzneria sp.]